MSTLSESVAAVEQEETQSVMTASKQKNRSVSDVIGLNIAHARSDSVVRGFIVDNSIKDHIAEMKTKLAASKDQDEIKQLTADIETYAAKTVNVSASVKISFSALWDLAVYEMLKVSIDNALVAKHKLVDVGDFRTGPSSAMRYYPLYNTCPSWTEYSAEHEKALHDARRATTKAKAAAKAAVATLDVSGAVAASAVSTPTDDTETVASVAESTMDEASSYGFSTYINTILKNLKKSNEKYAKIRVTKRLNEYIDELVLQGYKRMCGIMTVLLSAAKAKTMTEDHALNAATICMKDCGRSDEEAASLLLAVRDKLAAFHAYTRDEAARKKLSQTPEQLALQTARTTGRKVLTAAERYEREQKKIDERQAKLNAQWVDAKLAASALLALPAPVIPPQPVVLAA